MKTTYLNKTNATLKALFAALFLFATLSDKGQCQASFSYSLGPNGSVSFWSTSTNVPPNTFYYWNIGVNGPNAAITYPTNGAKSVCLNIWDSVSNCNSIYCDSIHITNAGSGNPCNPSVVYSLLKDSTTALTWNAYPSYPPNVTNATWSWGDGSSSTGLYPSHTYSAAGTYSTCVTVSVSCGTITATYCYVASIFKSTGGDGNSVMITVNVKASAATGIKASSKQADQLTIYPNPNNGAFTIDLGTQSKEVNVYIYNMLGEKVFEKNNLSTTKQSIDVSELSSGTYFVKVVSDTGYSNKKITVQK